MYSDILSHSVYSSSLMLPTSSSHVLSSSLPLSWWLDDYTSNHLHSYVHVHGKQLATVHVLSSVPRILTMRLHVHVSGQWCSSYVHLYMYMDCTLLCSGSTCTAPYLCVCLVLSIVCHWLNSYDCEWCTWIDSVFAYVGVIDLLNSYLYPSLPYSPPLYCIITLSCLITLSLTVHVCCYISPSSPLSLSLPSPPSPPSAPLSLSLIGVFV